MQQSGCIFLLAAAQFAPRPTDPALPLHFEYHVRQEPVYDSADAQGHDVHFRVVVEAVQVEDLFARLDGALAVDALPVFA